MRLANVVKKLEQMYDNVKYHNGNIPDVPSFLQDLATELRNINADEIYEARSKGAEAGFNHARLLITNRVLKNSELKTRGDMIAATEELNGDEETVLSEKIKETTAEERSVHAD